MNNIETLETAEPLLDRIRRQGENGIDDTLLPSIEKQTRDLAKKLDRELDRNGWRMFVSGSAHTMTNGKAPQRRNAEIQLVEAIQHWRNQVMELLPEREADLWHIVKTGLEHPELPVRKET